jgi:hypothetical protein
MGWDGPTRLMFGNPMGWAQAIDSQRNGVGPPLPIPNGMGWAHQANVWQSNWVGPCYRFPTEWGGPTATDTQWDSESNLLDEAFNGRRVFPIRQTLNLLLRLFPSTATIH